MYKNRGELGLSPALIVGYAHQNELRHERMMSMREINENSKIRSCRL